MVVSLKSVVERPVIAQDTEHDFTHLPITRVVRGAIGMQEVVFAEGRKGRKVIHTTNMRENRITDVKRIQNGEQYTLQGTAVLIPRVCNPNKGKICIYNEKASYVLPDCVIALQTKNEADAQTVYDALMTYWDDFRKIYNGTGAKYTTMDKVRLCFGIKA